MAVQTDPLGQSTVPIRVSVVDVNMPFASMIGFMVKWTLAAIPAVIILAFAVAAFIGLFSGFLTR